MSSLMVTSSATSKENPASFWMPRSLTASIAFSRSPTGSIKGESGIEELTEEEIKFSPEAGVTVVAGNFETDSLGR
ncbi:hypothetical protein A2U01_0035879 [Trifolium medium]|uniref:Uncharacterized protein n=1 Tax=Trifolium medium TaxID=97028 RepID=A0A392PSW4_9FABA|nr:hypothetical protein [Trifolium medium]